MSDKPLLIGLSGKAGSGKSTVGDYLAGAHGYAQFAFAGALKEMVQNVFLFTDEQMTLGKEVIDPRWGVSPRFCLQWLGTDVLRDVWPDIWIRHLRQEILDFLSINGQRPVVVTDVRFRDEAEALQRMGGVLVCLRRDKNHRLEACSTGIPGHVSEADLDGWEGWDHVLDNDGSLQDLAAAVELMLAGKADKAELAKAAG
jgi:dephospho-CoA kinase